jgi:hypothetical protein
MVGAIFSAACGGGTAVLKSSHYIGQVPPLVIKETISFIGAIKRANGKYRVKKLLSDNALEFRLSQLIDELNSRGIQKVYTCSYMPQSKGIVEKMNYTVMNRVRTLLCHSKLPKKLWVELLLSTVHLMNGTLCGSERTKSPLKCITGKSRL